MVAYILSTSNHGEPFRTNLRMFSSAGGRIVRSLADLDDAYDYDLVVDAVADCDVQGALTVKTAEHLAAGKWATESGLPLLSIDAPLGIDHDTGAYSLQARASFATSDANASLSPLPTAAGTPTIGAPIKPNYLVCLGAVRPCAVVADPETAVILLDVGLPPALWARVGVDDWERDTHGLDFVSWLSRD